MKRVKLTEEYYRKYNEFRKLPQEQREGLFVPTCRDFILGKVYDVINVERGWFRIVDESGEDYLYPPAMFEIVEELDSLCQKR